MTRPTVPVAELPVPRVELRWRPIRGKYYEDAIAELSVIWQHLAEGLVRTPISITKIGVGRGTFTEEAVGPDGDYRMPFRDGPHAQWMAKTLRLPLLLVVDGQELAQLVEPDERIQPYMRINTSDASAMFCDARDAETRFWDMRVTTSRYCNDEALSVWTQHAIHGPVQVIQGLMRAIEKHAASEGRIHDDIRQAYLDAKKLMDDRDDAMRDDGEEP